MTKTIYKIKHNNKNIQKMRELWIEAKLDDTLDIITTRECKNLAGYIYPSDSAEGKWEVVTLWEGEGYTAETQYEAETLANQVTIIGLLMKNRRDEEYD